LKLRQTKSGLIIGDAPHDHDQTFYSVIHFHHMLRVERRRTQRSKKPFLLLLLDISALYAEKVDMVTLKKLNTAVTSALRETDIRGWYENPHVIGIIFTEMASLDGPSVDGVFRKVHDRLSERFDADFVKKIRFSFHIYPEAKGEIKTGGAFDMNLYPELRENQTGRQFAMAVKHVIDRLGSAVLLLLLTPLLLILTAAIKLTSPGSVLFRQQRLGLNGRPFDMLKFRSMYTNCDSLNHKEYITKYIGDQKKAEAEPGVFKLVNDPRVTPVGRWLRKTSFDELPQLINVVKGEMSLVGPRPPISYECDLYDTWHMRRLLSCKPGITGLWQVMGRSRTTFDEMVRLDLKYISEWSLWLDLKILLKTPLAVFGGKGAY
jgi:lipopolysaccharide/colanic/teichoic acid biosynthesis glycosyltransferase